MNALAALPWHGRPALVFTTLTRPIFLYHLLGESFHDSLRL